MLWSATEPLPRRPERVLVAGTSGAGKTTVAAQLGRVLGLPHVEIDARRRLRREQLWNGNLEQPLHAVLTDPGHIVRWAWSTHHQTRGRVLALDRDRPALPIVRLRGRAEVDRWLDEFVRPLARSPAMPLPDPS